MLRDMRINRIFEGSSEIMRLIVAREAVDAHLSAAGELIDAGLPPARRARAAAQAGGFYARWLPTLVTGEGQRPGAYSEFGPLAAHLRYVERASRKLARATFYGMARWQGRLEHKQGFLGRIVDIGAELFAMSAACIRAQMDATAGSGTERRTVASELVGLFCAQPAHAPDHRLPRVMTRQKGQQRRHCSSWRAPRYLLSHGRKPASGPRSPQTPTTAAGLQPVRTPPYYAFTQVRCHIAGSRDRTRTYNLPVNSRTLCRLSYAGSTRIRVAHPRRKRDVGGTRRPCLSEPYLMSTIA